MNIIKKNKEILIMAHRGASNIAPENTLKSFEKAIELEANFIELDVCETKDGVLVIFHDENISRITGQSGFIKDLTFSELRTLDFGKGERIPTLREVIEITSGRINLNCEIKVEGIANSVIDLFKEYNIINSVIISSFIHNELLEFQKIEPKLKLASLEPNTYKISYPWDEKKQMIQFCVNNNLYAINPHYPILDQQFVDSAHEYNIKVFPWTVNRKSSLKKLIKFGVDGIITNDIVTLRKILNQEI
jgi:glycerophosphoryl diester phosphodiesterase